MRAITADDAIRDPHQFKSLWRIGSHARYESRLKSNGHETTFPPDNREKKINLS